METNKFDKDIEISALTQIGYDENKKKVVIEYKMVGMESEQIAFEPFLGYETFILMVKKLMKTDVQPIPLETVRGSPGSNSPSLVSPRMSIFSRKGLELK